MTDEKKVGISEVDAVIGGDDMPREEDYRYYRIRCNECGIIIDRVKTYEAACKRSMELMLTRTGCSRCGKVAYVVIE